MEWLRDDKPSVEQPLWHAFMAGGSCGVINVAVRCHIDHTTCWSSPHSVAPLPLLCSVLDYRVVSLANENGWVS